MLKVKLTRPDNTVVEIEGSAEDVNRILAAVLPAYYQPFYPLPYGPIGTAPSYPDINPYPFIYPGPPLVTWTVDATSKTADVVYGPGPNSTCRDVVYKTK